MVLVPDSKPHILITGGAGLIGTASKTCFEQKGWTVSTIDLKERDLDGRMIDHVGDIVEFKQLQEIMGGVDGILHLAAVSRVIDAELNKVECTRVNIGGTKRVLEAASSAKCSWFIFGSSREVYGEPASFPVSEENGVKPINHYGHAKVTGEKMVIKHCELNGIAHSNLRFSNVYGHSGDHQTRLVNAFILQALAGEPLNIHGGGQLFDFTHIEDTTEAIYTAAKLLHDKHDNLAPMHILPGEAVAIEDLATTVLELTGSDSDIIYTPGRDYDVERFHGDPKRMNDILGFECTINIRTGLDKCISHHSERLKLVTGANE
ncbi:MAG: NAD(P)-dependent oxidoreductase [Candidatus Poseidoniales archaeon]|nr:NAD(P)-dependent oxidoreductase [Candidatus Poseidoniales archaeon]